MDKIEIEILDDGSIKISTDAISMANHGGAEMLIRETIKLAGGEANRKQKAGHHHMHEHNGHWHSH